MKASKMLKNKLTRALNCNGILYTFVRSLEDKFHQKTGTTSSKVILGIYHEESAFVKISTSDSAITKSKKQPMILCTYEEGSELLLGDEVIIASKKYNVTNILNIQNYNIACDISLEVINNGSF